MNRRKAVSLLAGSASAIFLAGMSGLAQSTSDDASINWVRQVLVDMNRIKPGMSRAALMTLFKTEGGLSTGLERTYVSQHCPYFKVDVKFQAVRRPERDMEGRVTLGEDRRDRIATISRPYLQFGIMD